MLFNVKVQVELKQGVLDTAGRAVSKSMRFQGFEHVDRSVRIGKTIKMQLEAENKDRAAEHIDEICKNLLANPVIEQYEFSLEEA